MTTSLHTSEHHLPHRAFPGVSSLPLCQSLPEGDLYTFQFSNAYGAHVMRMVGGLYEFAPLSFADSEGQPIFSLPFCQGVLTQLDLTQVTDLIRQVEALPRQSLHSDALLDEEF